VRRKLETMKAFSVKNQKAEIYSPPFYNRTNGEAERNFASLVNDNQSTVSKFPEDYDLYLVGSFDEQAGVLLGLDTPIHVAKAIQFKKQQ